MHRDPNYYEKKKHVKMLFLNFDQIVNLFVLELLVYVTYLLLVCLSQLLDHVHKQFSHRYPSNLLDYQHHQR